MRRLAVAVYRVRGLLYYGAAVILLGNAAAVLLLDQSGIHPVQGFLVLVAMLTLVVSLALLVVVPRILPVEATRTVRAPVQGRWTGMNSPASKVPSHGVRAYGQAYAIDLVHEPADGERPGFGGEAMRASKAYPAFGQPVLAMIDGTVVRASGWRRDHRARSSWAGFAYMMAEGAVRELGGPGFIVGNHVTVRGDDGVFATVAHLQQGSPAVKVGDRVVAGQPIGRCGNSGNTSEPHVHAQLMDRASLWTGQGVPMAFADVTLDDGPERVDAVPANDQHMTAPAPGAEPRA